MGTKMKTFSEWLEIRDAEFFAEQDMNRRGFLQGLGAIAGAGAAAAAASAGGPTLTQQEKDEIKKFYPKAKSDLQNIDRTSYDAQFHNKNAIKAEMIYNLIRDSVENLVELADNLKAKGKLNDTSYDQIQRLLKLYWDKSAHDVAMRTRLSSSDKPLEIDDLAKNIQAFTKKSNTKPFKELIEDQKEASENIMRILKISDSEVGVDQENILIFVNRLLDVVRRKLDTQFQKIKTAIVNSRN